jgi:Holliday junction DNA helicase RuvA
MIGRLTGTVVDEAADGTIVLDVGGVGYEVHVPLGLLGRVGRENITLHVHTNVREDAIALFGFESPDDKVAFRTLLGVSGVGPKLALSILSTLDSPRLARAIDSGDKAAFKGISGVGKKTVEHLLVDLKGKLHPGAVVGIRAPQRPHAAAPNADVVVALLVNMGFKRLEAEAAVATLGEERVREEPVDQLLREALGRLG